MRLSIQSLKDSIMVLALDAGIYTKILGRHLQARSCSSQVKNTADKLTIKLKHVRHWIISDSLDCWFAIFVRAKLAQTYLWQGFGQQTQRCCEPVVQATAEAKNLGELVETLKLTKNF